MSTLDNEAYKESKDKLFVYFEDETLERVMEGLVEFANKYIETKKIPALTGIFKLYIFIIQQFYHTNHND